MTYIYTIAYLTAWMLAIGILGNTTSRRDRAAFRMWMLDVFGGMNGNRVSGRWPEYRVDRV